MTFGALTNTIMATTAAEEGISAAETPLLNDVVSGTVDFKGRPTLRSKSGGWKSASFIVGSTNYALKQVSSVFICLFNSIFLPITGVEMAERFSYYAISSNLVSYLTVTFGQSTAAAAANLNVWYGTAALSPILGALLADSYLGRYWTIIYSSLLYILGLGFLTLSSLLNSFKSSGCNIAANNMPCSPSKLHTTFFFFSLYAIALAQGGHRPCVQAFGADQFDVKNRKECKAKSSFFNWFFWFSCIGTVLALSVMPYIQENLSWALGFIIPSVTMFFALIVFWIGTITYRFNMIRAQTQEREAQRVVDSVENEKTSSRVRVAKEVLRLAPIWFTSLGYSIVYAQPSTLFTKQAITLDRHITSNFQIPAASLQLFIPLAIMVFVSMYDFVLVPVARSITKNPSGISKIQRIGTGLVLSLASIVSAAVVERKRIATAFKYGLEDAPSAVIPMSVWWLAPQYLLSGMSDVFGMVGLQEFFYDQVPSEVKSIGLSLYLSILGVGSLMSSLLIYLIQDVTSRNGEEGWFSNNLNRAHLDYFYWVLAGVCAFSFGAFVYINKSYVYSRRIIGIGLL